MNEAAATVLLVEDDEDIRDTLLEILEEDGFKAVGAADGREALAWLRTRAENGGPRPAVILLDLMMPVMNGAAFRAAQRADRALADIPVVALTADADIARKSADLDTAAFLKKPLRLQELLDTVHRIAEGGD